MAMFVPLPHTGKFLLAPWIVCCNIFPETKCRICHGLIPIAVPAYVVAGSMTEWQLLHVHVQHLHICCLPYRLLAVACYNVVCSALGRSRRVWLPDVIMLAQSRLAWMESTLAHPRRWKELPCIDLPRHLRRSCDTAPSPASII